MKYRNLFFLPVLLFSFACNATDDATISAKSVKSIIKYYVHTSVESNKNDFYVSGDFNRDGYTDLAVLFKPDKKLMPNSQLHISKPWTIPETVQPEQYHRSLVIINGRSDGFSSHKNKVFVLIDYSGALETPSFQLIIKKRNEKDYGEHRDMLPKKVNGDIIILPTEAGIDTYVYWDKNSYKLHIPEEEP